MKFDLHWEVNILDEILDATTEKITFRKRNYHLLKSFQSIERETIFKKNRNGIESSSGYAYNTTSILPLIFQYNQWQIEQCREWVKYPDLFKLLEYMKLAFKNNLIAHNCINFFSRKKRYQEKAKAINRIIEVISTFNYPFLKWGYQTDVHTISYPYILYFQIGDFQISFHLNQLPNDQIPIFQGTWDKIVNVKFPIKLSYVKKLLKKHKYKLDELKGNCYGLKLPSNFNTMEELKSQIDQTIKDHDYAKERLKEKQDKKTKNESIQSKYQFHSLDKWLLVDK